jgi:hypothetical protein
MTKNIFLRSFFLASITFISFVLSSNIKAQNRFNGVGKIGHTNSIKNVKLSENVTFLSYDQTMRIRPYKPFRNTYVNTQFLANLSFLESQPEKKELELRQFAIETTQGVAAFRAGYQEIVWGETLVAPVTDIWQHVDFSKDFFLENERFRKPATSVYGLFTVDSFSIDIITIPIPQPPEFSSPTLPLEIKLKRKKRTILDAEGGIRFGMLLGDFDFKLFFATTENRRPKFLLTPPFTEETSRVLTLGSNISVAVSDAIIRIDSVYQTGEFFTPRRAFALNVSKSLPRFGLVDGFDIPIGNGNFVIQHQLDLWHENTVVMRKDNWIAAQLRQPLQDFETDFFVMKGLENKDFWWRIKLKLNVSSNFSVAYEFHGIEGDGKAFHPSFVHRRINSGSVQYNF